MKRIVLVGIIALVAMVICAVVFYDFLQPYLRARNLLSQISALQVGRSNYLDSQQVGKRLGSLGNDLCIPADCYWTFSVDNFKIPILWRGEGVRFIGGFRVQSSVVTEQRFMLQIGTGFDAQTATFWERENWPHYPKQFFVNVETTPDHPHFRSYVNLTPATPADLRDRYLSFNLNCLWKYHGCKDAEELLPTIDWEAVKLQGSE
jgi:hypothetical protein